MTDTGANLPFGSDKTDAPVNQKQWFVGLFLANISRKRKPPSNWFLALRHLQIVLVGCGRLQAHHIPNADRYRPPLLA